MSASSQGLACRDLPDCTSPGPGESNILSDIIVDGYVGQPENANHTLACPAAGWCGGLSARVASSVYPAPRTRENVQVRGAPGRNGASPLSAPLTPPSFAIADPSATSRGLRPRRLHRGNQPFRPIMRDEFQQGCGFRSHNCAAARPSALWRRLSNSGPSPATTNRSVSCQRRAREIRVSVEPYWPLALSASDTPLFVGKPDRSANHVSVGSDAAFGDAILDATLAMRERS
jgi:hypothetical protein